MQISYWMVLTALTLSATAIAADATDRKAPYDSNPACMDRTTDSSTGNCVVKDEGTPRHAYPPRQALTSGAPTPPPTSAANPLIIRKATATGK